MVKKPEIENQEVSEVLKAPEVPQEVPKAPISREEMPTMIKFNEFLSSVSKSREFLPETIGGFVSWMKREGMPKALPFTRWKELFVEYSKRIV